MLTLYRTITLCSMTHSSHTRIMLYNITSAFVLVMFRGTVVHNTSEYNHYSVTDDSLAVCSATSYKKDCDDDMASILPLVLIFLSQFVLGIGSTLYYALGQPYLDDNVKKTQTPMLLGSNQSQVTRYTYKIRPILRSQNIVGFCRFRMFIIVFTKARQLDLI